MDLFNLRIEFNRFESYFVIIKGASSKKVWLVMFDEMTPVSFPQLLKWILDEYRNQQTIFGISPLHFFYKKKRNVIEIFDEALETPLGPAAGPHTQLAQNIIAAYLTGGRFIELKTVQKLDRLKIDKPCIYAQDEGYNVEWSQELALDQSHAEYVKAWILLHLLKETLGLSDGERPGFVFNLSVGYDLEGIQTPGMSRFIDEMINASGNEVFTNCKNYLENQLNGKQLHGRLKKDFGLNEKDINRLQESMHSVSPHISRSVTLSTMHGCPPQEIEAIVRYLIAEKNLHTFVKLNPTLLGYEWVSQTLQQLGYRDIRLDRSAFEKDLQFIEAIPMISRLQEFARAHEKIFGVKLSNTLGVVNTGQQLPGKEMYLSGRALFPLTINLAYRLAESFDGKLNISYSGGLTQDNIDRVLECGIYPLTMVTDLLKPGGYARLFEMAQRLEEVPIGLPANGWDIDLDKLKQLAADSLQNPRYQKQTREITSIKIEDPLVQFDCYLAPCIHACPIHQDVAGYIRLVEEGRFVDALELIYQQNPLPHITGYICDHQCMSHCTRWDYDCAVLIRDLKKEAAEKGFDTFTQKFFETYQPRANGIRVAVVGAGPAGLAAAYFLSRAGCEVTVFDKKPRAGGVVQHIIPPFRLPQWAIDRDIDFIRKLGVHFQFDLPGNFSIDDLQQAGFKYVFIGIGAGKSNPLSLQGDGESVLNALDFLQDFHLGKSMQLGKHVAVIGGGNSAMDGARAALRCPGVETVTIVYRRTREWMPADREEFEAAIADGVIFKELLLPIRFQNGVLTCQQMTLGEPDRDGRPRAVPIKGSEEQLPADTVISAIGEHPDSDFFIANRIPLDENGKVRFHEQTNETYRAGVYIGGDALRGPSTVVESLADGKKAAEAILSQEFPRRTASSGFTPEISTDSLLRDVQMRKGKILPVHPGDLQAEAARCLSCNFLCNKCVEVCPNRANIAIDTTSLKEHFRDRFQILHVEALCNHCGNCETFCPYQGAPYKDKITLYWRESDLIGGENDGFFLQTRKQEYFDLKLRFQNRLGTVRLKSDGSIIQSSFGMEKDATFRRYTELIRHILKNYSYLIPLNGKFSPEETSGKMKPI
ncbi:MAG: putative selenate reductase subunit YgfK [Calditrichia bacterium]